MPLDAYVESMMSPAFDCIVHLSISVLAFSNAELVRLSKLANIGTLAIGGRRSDFNLDYCVIRAWASAATEVGAFGKLRILTLRSQGTIMPSIFTHLRRFPSLIIFNVEDCKVRARTRDEALALGWRRRRLASFAGQEVVPIPSQDLTIKAYHSEPEACTGTGSTRETREIPESVPAVHFCLGRLPADAALDIPTSKRTTFHRLHPERQASETALAQRCSDDDQRLHKQPPQKRTVRPSKVRDFEELLNDLHS